MRRRSPRVESSAFLSLIGLALLALPGCVVVETDFQEPLSPDALAQIQPGVTTRSEVLDILGPPEEFRRPGFGEEARFLSPQEDKVFESRDVFSRDTYTYGSESRLDRSLVILPFVIPLFEIRRTDAVTDRVVITFDRDDVVDAIAQDVGAQRE